MDVPYGPPGIRVHAMGAPIYATWRHVHCFVRSSRLVHTRVELPGREVSASTLAAAPHRSFRIDQPILCIVSFVTVCRSAMSSRCLTSPPLNVLLVARPELTLQLARALVSSQPGIAREFLPSLLCVLVWFAY